MSHVDLHELLRVVDVRIEIPDAQSLAIPIAVGNGLWIHLNVIQQLDGFGRKAFGPARGHRLQTTIDGVWLERIDESPQTVVVTYCASGIHHDAELNTRLFGDLHYMVDRERSGEVTVQVHQRELIVDGRPEAWGKSRCGEQSARDTSALQKCSAFHDRVATECGMRMRMKRLYRPTSTFRMTFSASLNNTCFSASCASTTATAATFTMSFTSAPYCRTWTGFKRPIKMGPIASAPPNRDSSL